MPVMLFSFMVISGFGQSKKTVGAFNISRSQNIIYPVNANPEFGDLEDGLIENCHDLEATIVEWKHEGYFQRNRDIGQVFTTDNDFLMSSVVL